MSAAEKRFAELTGSELAGVNSRLCGRALELLTREAWEAEQDAGSAGASALGRKLKPREVAALGERLVRSAIE